MKRVLNYLPPVGILALAVLGARLQNNLFIYAMIVGICIVMGLVAFGKIGEKYYPFYIFSISLSLLYQSTLISNGLIGTDIHSEYYFYNRALDGWDITIPHSYDSAIGTTLIAPFLTNYLHIPGYWIYKALYPFLFAFAPLILYYIFKDQFGSKIAFLSTFFFVMIPTYTLEMIGLPRQMLAELMFAICLFLVVASKWKLKIKVPLLVVCSILGAMFHYVIGPAIMLYLGLGCILLLLFKNRIFPIRWLATIFIILSMVTIVYYGSVAQGIPLDNMLGVSSKQLVKIAKLIPKPTPTPTPTPIAPTDITLLATWEMPINWDRQGHSEGTECDGTYIWWSSGDLLAKTLVSNPDWENQLAINNHAKEDGTVVEQINGICLHDNYIYTTGIIYTKEPYGCWVKWYNKDTLEFVGERSIYWDGGGSCQEGLSYCDGFWWVVFFNRHAIAQYDTSLNYIQCYDLPGQNGNMQGLDWLNGQLWTTSTGGVMNIWNWNGTSFNLAKSLEKPPGVVYAQSFGITPDGQYLYWASFSENNELLLKFSIGGISIPNPTPIQPTIKTPSYLMGQEPLIRTALGLDFMQSSLVGKVFRVFQYITELCLILGFILLVRDRKRLKAEYLSFCFVSILLLLCCVFLPKFSGMLNATRFYHLALFLVAPCLITGGLLIFRNLKILTLCLLIPYFLFTSGCIFEATQQSNIQTINIPYSIPLSGERVDITGIFTDNDIAVRDWAVANLDYMYADINGCLLFSERVEMDWFMDWRALNSALVEGKGFTYSPPYIFLSERNTETRTLVFKPNTNESATGERQVYTFKELNINLDKCEVVYQIGDALIIKYAN
jgi:uncharacterized membrane protein